jgi:transglutaminase-like putative cysteine protease
MVRLSFFVQLKYEIVGAPADFIFNVHATRTQCQALVNEDLQVRPDLPVSLFTDPAHGNRYARLRAWPGDLELRYEATVDIAHFVASPDSIAEVPIAALPPETLPYIYPSRYCQSDRLQQIARDEFGMMTPGYGRVRAIRDWVQQRTKFQSGSSNPTTSAIDTLSDQAGVCRDFAHLMIAICRALNIPARFVTGIDYGADPIYGPPDFHAYVEAFLGGRWYLFDPTGMAVPMGLIRLGTGRDAADVSFATIFGAVNSFAPLIGIEALEDSAKGFAVPLVCADALSTSDYSDLAVAIAE